MNIRDKYPTRECRNCGEQTPCDVYNETLPHNGFCLDLTGHYGGFTDDVEGEFSKVLLCHDCSLLLARALPGVFGKGGYHSMLSDETEKSCCEFAWSTIDDKTHVGDGKGNWIACE